MVIWRTKKNWKRVSEDALSGSESRGAPKSSSLLIYIPTRVMQESLKPDLSTISPCNSQVEEAMYAMHCCASTAGDRQAQASTLIALLVNPRGHLQTEGHGFMNNWQPIYLLGTWQGSGRL